ncbi:MAG TPA: acetylxylan esterase [Gemmataceae bacterium]|nr:acetylxylan esterase [Gemmataceae bacterium]
MRTASYPLLACLLPVIFLVFCVWAHGQFPEPDQLPSQRDLPDPLTTFDGKRVTTSQQWFGQRRPELRALFQHYMYGWMPPAPKVRATVTREDREYFDGRATLKEVTLAFGGLKVPRMHLLLVLPHSQQPVPVFLGLNFAGNHTALKDPKITLPEAWLPASFPGVKKNHATDAGRGTQVNVWSIQYVIARGYGVATCYCGDIAPDHPGFADGVFPYFRKPGQKTHGPDDWGAIAAWAWGLQRAMDYLVTDREVDAHRIAVVGHSRLGKAAIVAAAFDDRIALAIPHQAGCGGTAPSRGKVGESVKQINDRFPHWFDAEFKKFNAHPDRLPFDQNCLVALVAPRPVLFTNATDDQWANPAGQFDVLKAADPVYRLLGAEGLAAKRMPPVNTLVNSRLGYHIRPGKHSMGRQDWKVWLEYADKHLRESAPSRGKP